MTAKTAGVLTIMVGVQLAAAITHAGMNGAQTIEPVPSVQAWIKQVVLLETQDQLVEAISQFKQQGMNTEETIRQLIYFEVNTMAIYREDHITAQQVSDRAMVANGVIAFLLDWDPKTKKLSSSSASTLIKAVVPYLGTEDPRLRKELQHTLEWVDQLHGAKKDFTQYESYLKSNADNATGLLVTYMYDRDPATALLSMARVFGDKATETELTAELKGDPKATLQSLADRPEWWAHLYIATIMEKEPYLRTPELLKKLEQETNPLVREKVSKLKGKLQPK